MRISAIVAAAAPLSLLLLAACGSPAPAPPAPSAASASPTAAASDSPAAPASLAAQPPVSAEPDPAAPSNCTAGQPQQWNLNGANEVDVAYDGISFVYSVTITQNGSCLSGTLDDPYYPTSGPISGTVSGDSITFTFSYPSGSIQGTRTYTGTISQPGVASGTWTQTGDESPDNGTWTLADKATTATTATTFAALGDSYSAGNGTPQASGDCERSPQAWPELVPGMVGGNAISPSVALLACSGAESTNSGNTTVEDLPAQITQLRGIKPAPSLVTVTIGGDDGTPEHVGFRNVLINCIQSSKYCDIYDAQESSWIANDEPTLLREDYSAIKAADPSAVVLAVGYPQIFPDKSCDGFNEHDETILNNLAAALDAAIASAAAEVPGVIYVPAISAFSGHLLCSEHPDVVDPLTVAAFTGIHGWMHPNVDGQNAIANVVAEFIESNHLTTG